jgi:hypothetical protein
MFIETNTNLVMIGTVESILLEKPTRKMNKLSKKKRATPRMKLIEPSI